MVGWSTVYEMRFKQFFTFVKSQNLNTYGKLPWWKDYETDLIVWTGSPSWIQFRMCRPARHGGGGWAIHLDPTNYSIREFLYKSSNTSIAGKNPNVLGIITQMRG